MHCKQHRKKTRCYELFEILNIVLGVVVKLWQILGLYSPEIRLTPHSLKNEKIIQRKFLFHDRVDLYPVNHLHKVMAKSEKPETLLSTRFQTRVFAGVTQYMMFLCLF